ncbi:MAG: ABC transporter permease [Bacteroidota bacterium]
MAILKYVGKRLLTIAVSIVIITIITYALMYAAPGDFFDIQRFQMTGSTSAGLTQEQLEILRRGFEEKYGLDKPVWQQILIYLKGAIRFKFGPGFYQPTSNIEDLIKEKFPVTFTLSMLAVALAILLGIPLGILAALKRNTVVDYGANFLGMIGQLIPSYVVGIFFVALFSVKLGWLPSSGWGGLKQAIMPVVALSLLPLAAIVRFMRVSLLDTLNQDYVRTAYAKGGTERTVIMKHALRNSLIPIVTILGPQLAFLFAGSAVFIENMFRVPGLGQLFINAAYYRDYPLLVTSTFVLALTIMLMNLIVDIVYAVLDPRIKLQ